MEWTSLKLNRIRESPTGEIGVSTEPIPYPQVTSVLPPELTSKSFDFNLVRIVEEHGPPRLEQIDKEIKKYQDKIDALAVEREKVQALVLAIK
jgi:hypothetical protein